MFRCLWILRGLRRFKGLWSFKGLWAFRGLWLLRSLWGLTGFLGLGLGSTVHGFRFSSSGFRGVLVLTAEEDGGLSLYPEP